MRGFSIIFRINKDAKKRSFFDSVVILKIFTDFPKTRNSELRIPNYELIYFTFVNVNDVYSPP